MKFDSILLVRTALLLLLPVLANAQDHLEREQAARQLHARGEWSASARAWGELARENPARAALWQNYAYSLHAAADHDAAIEAWERALELGYLPRETLYNLACAESLRGELDAALARLEEALEAGWQSDEQLWKDADLDPLRELSAFQEITGIQPPASEDRQERWSYDLDHLERRLRWLHHDLHARVGRERFTSELAQLKARVEELSDVEVLVQLQRIVALVGDGHTSVDLLPFPFHQAPGHDPRPSALHLPEHEFPIDLYRFTDGLFVRDAFGSRKDLVGCRVVRIAGVGVDEALARVAPFCSVDNEMGLLQHAPRRLTLPDVAGAAGLTNSEGGLVLELIPPDGGYRRVSVQPEPMPGGPERFRRRAGSGNPNADAPVPDYLGQPLVPFWWKLDDERRCVYFQMNMVMDAGGLSLEDTCREVFEVLDGTLADTLVIDLRHNSGGNNGLLRPLIHGVIRNDVVNRAGHLFVITGRRTFSAAVNCVNQLERETAALFVGEPPAAGPNFVGERDVLTLPYSGARVSVSSLYWQDGDPRDGRTWVAPDLPAPLSSEDWFANRDPAMEAIHRELGR